MKYIALFLFLMSAGCSTKDTTTAKITHIYGQENGFPKDVMIAEKEEEHSATQVDTGPALQAAILAATGDIRGSIKALAERPIPSTQEIIKEVEKMFPKSSGGIDGTTTAGIVGGGLLLAQQYMARRKADKDAEDEWKRANDAHSREVELARQLPPKQSTDSYSPQTLPIKG